MILNVEYMTNTDVGIFISSAKLETETGQLIEIDLVDDDQAEDIDMIYGKSICFSYNEEKFEYPVDYIDEDSNEEGIIDYKATAFFRMVESEKLKNELEENLTDNKNGKKKMKC